MQGLDDKVAVVTGGTSGIGQAIAVRLAAEGAHVAINYRQDPQSARQTDELVHQALEECRHAIETHGVDHILVQADVSSEAQIEEMFAETIAKLGGVDILINNAGIQIQADSDQMTTADFDRALAVNLRGALSPPARRSSISCLPENPASSSISPASTRSSPSPSS